MSDTSPAPGPAPSPAPSLPPEDWTARIVWRRFTFKGAFQQGWETFKSAYGFALVACITVFGLLFLGNMITQGIQSAFMASAVSLAKGGTPSRTAIGLASIASLLVSLVAIVFLQWPMYASFAYSAIASTRRERITTRTVLRGYVRLGRAIFALLLIFVASLVLMLPLGAIIALPAILQPGSSPMSWVAILLLVAIYSVGVGFVIWRLFMGVMLAMDEEVRQLTTIECLKCGWSMTRPFAWPFFGLMVCLYVMNVVAMFLFCLPMLFFTAPLSLCVLGAAYHQLAFGEGLFKSPFVCNACGYPIEPGMGTCPECGQPTSAPQTWTSETPPTIPPPIA